MVVPRHDDGCSAAEVADTTEVRRVVDRGLPEWHPHTQRNCSTCG